MSEDDPIPLLSLNEGASKDTIWTYQGNGTPGAVRLIAVSKLLATETPSIDLFEWKDIFASSKFVIGRKHTLPTNIPRYATISHVWAQTEEVERIALEANRPLSICIDDPNPHVISWHGLIQCARAAKVLKCDYLWLDLLCLDQLSKEDKKLQIKNMGRIYGHASVVLVMFGGVSAAQGIEHTSSWIDRAWTLQEATLCDQTYGVVDWRGIPDPTASFSLDNDMIIKDASLSIRNYTRFTALPGGIAIIPLRALLRFSPGAHLGSGYLGNTAMELKVPMNSLGMQFSATSVLSMAIDAMWPDDEKEGEELSVESSEHDSVVSMEDDRSHADQEQSFNADYESESEHRQDDDDAEFYSDYGNETGTKSNPYAKRKDKYEEDSDDDLDSEEDRGMLRHLTAWRSMWLRTSTKAQDMVFSMMHLLNADIQVDYGRKLEDILFELIEKTSDIPIWLLIGNHIPVMPNSGLIPMLPMFSPNSVPSFEIDGSSTPTGKVVSLDAGCSSIDIKIKSTSVTEGHNICARIFNVVEWSTSQVGPPNPSGANVEAERFDLKLTSNAYNVTTTCVVHGSVGPLLVLIGEWNTPNRPATRKYYQKGRFPFVYFLSQNGNNVWQKCGVGILHLPLFKKAWNHKLQSIGRSHLRVGNNPNAPLLPCNCNPDDTTTLKEDIEMALPKSQEELNEELLKASIHGDESDIRLLLSIGADVNHQSEDGDFALQRACSRDERHSMIALLKGGANVNLTGGEHGTALQAAVCTFSEWNVSFLLSYNAEVNSQGGRYGSPLRAACNLGLRNIAELLIKNGADIHFTGSKPGHPMRDAIEGGHPDLVNFLLDCGVDVNMRFDAPDNKSCVPSADSCVTALQTACHHQHHQQKEMVHLLIKKGANVNAQCGYFGDALTVAAFYNEMLIIKLLVENGANVNSRCEESYFGTPLQAACASRYGYIGEAAIYLINMGVNVNAIGGYFGTALQAAAFWYQDEVVKKLIASGADVNARGGRYGTALQAAAVDKHQGHITRILIENGADINVDKKYVKRLKTSLEHTYEGIVRRKLEKNANANATDPRFGSVLQAAALGEYVEVVILLGGGMNLGKFREEAVSSWEHEEVIRLLVNKGADINLRGGRYNNALQAACFYGNINVVTFLIAHGGDVNSFGGHYGSALQAASRYGFRDGVASLLDNGANPNTYGGQYYPPLHAAVCFGHQDIVELLQSCGADIHIVDTQGRNLLHIAVSTGNINMTNYLQKHGVDMYAVDYQGRSCLHHAACSGSNLMVDLLLKIFSDVDMRDRDNWTPLHWAARIGEKSVVERFLDARADKQSIDNKGWTPLKIAVFHGNLSLKPLLSLPLQPVAEMNILQQQPVFFGAGGDADFMEVGYLHQYALCYGCRLKIYGVRYNCEDCPDFDYCFKCRMSADVTHDSGHDFEPIDRIADEQESSSSEWSDEPEIEESKPKENQGMVYMIS